MNYEHLIVEHAGAVTRVMLNRPERLTALNPGLVRRATPASMRRRGSRPAGVAA